MTAAPEFVHYSDSVSLPRRQYLVMLIGLTSALGVATLYLLDIWREELQAGPVRWIHILLAFAISAVFSLICLTLLVAILQVVGRFRDPGLKFTIGDSGIGIDHKHWRWEQVQRMMFVPRGKRVIVQICLKGNRVFEVHSKMSAGEMARLNKICMSKLEPSAMRSNTFR